MRSLGAGLGGFAVRCGSPLNEDGGGEAGSAWTRLGSSVLTGVNLLQQPSGGSSNSSGGGSLLYALTEASINAPGAVCSPGQRIAALRVQAVPLEVAGGAAGAGDVSGTAGGACVRCERLNERASLSACCHVLIRLWSMQRL